MPPNAEKSSLKRSRASAGEAVESKKPRRSARLSNVLDDTEQLKQGGLPSPVTRKETTDDTVSKGTVSPPTYKDDVQQRATPVSSPLPPSQMNGGLSSPPSDTQPYSQFLAPPPIAYEVEDEEAEGVWGYLVPVDGLNDPLVLRDRAACPVPPSKLGIPSGRQKVSKKHFEKTEEEYEKEKRINGVVAGGYLVGRHPECDRKIDVPTVSNRHAIFFKENKGGDAIAVVEDLSGNGTYVNDAYIGRNKRRELQDGDEVSILDAARFIFRYPRNRDTSNFRQQYSIQGQLGKGHFATVYLATEKNTGMRYAVKKFEKRSGPGERNKVDGLQQEIAVLKGVSHPNMLCLKDTFDESDGVYLVLELAPEGELFNWIVMKQKLSETETRKVFIQLFQGMKYLHERNIVHRDIKPENILLIDKSLNVKLADFGLAKIIGEESFTTTLCGTPSYVAPEILQQTNHRRYTRAVDVWSLGVVLYICLCGFPPFSDELYSNENPYTLSQQIKMGRFDYPSPYWDSVGDPALDLIDRMLTVEVEQRISIDECLEHPWTTQPSVSVTDSTDGLTGALAGLDFSKRKPVRERTLLSSINDVKVERVLNTPTDGDAPPVKVFDKNPSQRFVLSSQQVAGAKKGAKKGKNGHVEKTIEPSPAAARDPQEFAEMGGKGDEVLFDEAGESRYPDATMRAGAPNK
ncbi:serine/threonine protein kinase [Vermiconidia calcicola]|uniref:Serine/threonine protein kinase n=1 Tax=Vermiconidia calcicola TaxID=1690605 RepID=A0ACC3MEN5_9PEZI|nr:serine/threonine protein kinase [Vermiconidia calcicola]